MTLCLLRYEPTLKSGLIDSIKKNPFQGSSLGGGIRKVRFGVDDKGGGKSGGMRVITFIVNKIY